MKKLLSFTLIACFSTVLFGQTIVSTTPSNKNIILEEFTGTECLWCPEGHKIANEIMADNPGRVWVINIHSGSFSGNDPNYKTEWGNALNNQAGTQAFPGGTVNRQVFAGIPTQQYYGAPAALAYDRERWAECVARGVAEPSPVNVAATATIDWETRLLTVYVEVYYTENAVQRTNKLNVALLQNNVLGPQEGKSLYPEMVFGDLYKHNNMLRHLLTGQWGVDIPATTAGTFFTETFTYTIPEHIRNVPLILEDLSVIAFVCENQKTILTGCKAKTTWENSIKDIPDIAISIAPNPMNDELFIKGIYDKLEIFSVTGQIVATAYNQPTVNVSHLAKGIYIVKMLSNGQTCTVKVVK